MEARTQTVPDTQPAPAKGKGGKGDKKPGTAKKGKSALGDAPKEEASSLPAPLKLFSGMKTREEEDLDAASIG